MIALKDARIIAWREDVPISVFGLYIDFDEGSIYLEKGNTSRVIYKATAKDYATALDKAIREIGKIIRDYYKRSITPVRDTCGHTTTCIRRTPARGVYSLRTSTRKNKRARQQ